MTTALFIGRFQPFHNGHFHAVQSALETYDHVVIGIGSAQHSHTLENPLSAEERKNIIRNCIPDITVVAIEDRNNDVDWMDWIEANISFDVGISGNDHVRRIFNNRGHPIKHPDYQEVDYYSGTAIRELVRTDEPWRDRVPDCALTVLDEIGFAERVQELTAED